MRKPRHDLLTKQLTLNAGNWQLLPGEAHDIGIGGEGSIWVVGRNQGIYRWMGNDWQKVYGGAVRIAVAQDGTSWVVNSQGNIYRKSGDSWSNWVQLPGSAKDIGIGSGGQVWVIGSNDLPHRWNGNGRLAFDGAISALAVRPNGLPGVVAADGRIYLRR